MDETFFNSYEFTGPYILNEVKFCISVGDAIKVSTLTGYVGEIDIVRDRLYLWSNNSNYQGYVGNKKPLIMGFKYSCVLNLKNSNTIFLGKKKNINKKTICNTITEFLTKQELFGV